MPSPNNPNDIFSVINNINRGRGPVQMPAQNRGQGPESQDLNNLLSAQLSEIDSAIQRLESIPDDQRFNAKASLGVSGARDYQINALKARRQRIAADLANPENRNTGFFGDVATKLGSGVREIDRQIGYLSGQRDVEERAIKEQEIARARLSDYGREASEKGILGDDMTLGQRAYAAGLATAETLPSLASSAVAGVAVAAAVPEVAAVAVGTRALQLASRSPRIASLLGITGSMAPAQAGRIAISMGANAGVEGVQSGASAGSSTKFEAEQQILSDPDAFAATEIGQRLIKETGGDINKAARMASEEIAADAAVGTGIATALLALPAAAFEAKLLAGAANRGFARETLSGAGREALQEGPQSGSEQLISNISLQRVGSDVGTFENVAKAAGEGAIVGGLLGGGLGAVGGAVTEKAPDATREDTDLLLALEGFMEDSGEGGLPTPEQQALLEGPDMSPVRAGGLNLTPAQLLEFAENNSSNPRIASIMSQPIGDMEKASQVARTLNAAEADRVEARAVEQVSGLVGPTQSVTSSKQMIGNLLDGIGPEVVAESQTLTAIRNLVDQPQKGQRFVNGIRDIVGNYAPTTREGESFVARPERGADGSVIMGQAQVAEEAQREREADQAFRLSQLRQERFDRATGTTRQREDLRAGAPEPETQFFLGENYGDLAGTPVEIVQAASPDTVRLQYESPTETDASGRPVTISEEISIFDVAARVIRGTNRMTQDLAANLRAPKAGVGTDMDPRRSVDRTRTRAVSTTEEAGLPAIQPNLVNEGYRARPTTDVAPQSAQETPAQENIPLPQGVESTPDQAPDQAQQLPAPPQGLPAPARALPATNVPEQEGTTPEVQDQEASVPEREAVDEEIDIDNDPRMVELNDRFDAAIERVQETENTREARKLAKALIKEGVIDEDAYVDIDEAIKDETDRGFKHDAAMAAIEDAIETQRDNAAADLESEILDETDAGDTRFSGRVDRVGRRTLRASDVAARTQTSRERAAQEERAAEPEVEQAAEQKPDIDHEAVIEDRLKKIADRGRQGKIIANRLRSLLQRSGYSPIQVYYAFQMGDVMSRVLPQKATVDILFVPSIKADSAQAAAASGVDLGEEAGGRYDVYEISQNGFSGLITLSLNEDLLSVARENAAHEAFHVIQDMLKVYDAKAYEQINKSFRDGMTLKDLDPSILRVLKTTEKAGGVSFYDDLIGSFGDTPLAFYEAQAVAFGALVDAKESGSPMRGLKASFIRVVDMVSAFRRQMGNILRKDKVRSVAEVFEGYSSGAAQERLTEAAPTQSEINAFGYSAPERYSARTKPVASATGKGVSEGNMLGFEPDLRVKVSGVTMPPKSLILASTNNKNAARQIAELDGILDAYPNAGVDPNEWAGMMSYAFKSQEVPVPPYRFIKEVTGNGSVENLRRLTQGQIDDASHGFDNAREFRRAYTNGELSEVTTGKLFLWSFLSRGISPYTQEAMFIDSFSGIDKYIRLAADGKFDESTVKEYLDWAKTIAPAGSGQAGAGAKSNLNSFGQDFLLKMGRRGDDGKSHLRRLHEMLADPDMTGRQVRREFATFGEGVGIDNKVVSFTLLVVGFNDVMVLDRVQIRQLWDDGRFKDRNLYDGRKVDGKVVTGSALAPIGEGVRGILVYEAIERALDAQVSKIYSAIGRPQDASIGRFHWETWVADSQQEASHGTLDAILKDAKGDDYAIAQVTAKQGEYGAYEYGARYGVDIQNNPYYIYSTPDGGLYKFDVPSYRQFLGAIKKQGKNGVVPTGFSVQKAGNQPWYNQPEVNREKIRELAGQYGTEVQPERRGASAVRGADANQDAADGAGPDTVRYSGRTASPAQIADRIRSRFPSTPRVEGGPAREGNVGRRRGGVLADDLTGRVPVKSTYSHSEGVKAAYAELGVDTPDFHELTGGRASAALYSRLINEAKVDNRFGASVYVYPTEEYTDMRLFLSSDGTAGFALKGDDIVSAFKAGKSPHRAVAYPMVRMAVALGGRRLDAFDTVLPPIYSVSGFRAISRLRWSDEAMDDVMRREWSKETFAVFNNGEPDVVFMAYDENREGVYQPDEGEYTDDYDTAVAMQTAAVSGQRLSGRRSSLPPSIGVRQAAGQRVPLRAAPAFTQDDLNFGGNDPSNFENLVYNLQDKLIDLKKIQQSIVQTGKRIDESADVYNAEERYHGRAAARTKYFVLRELNPLIEDMKAKGVSLEQIDEYLHARHAKERNAQIRKVNPEFQGAGSGMTDTEADAIISGFPKARLAQLEKLGARVDAIVKETQKMMVEYGLETQATIDTWNNTYSSYVPLQREGFEEGGGMGQGFSTQGSTSRRALGSGLPVSDILANIAMQRERVISRGERNRVGNALVALALQNPNDSFWFVIDPKGADSAAAIQKLVQFGIDPDDAANVMGAPVTRTINKTTGLVEFRRNQLFMNASNVLATRINGEDKFVIFNSRNPRSKRMVESLKNLDVAQMSGFIGGVAKYTRYLASINTQYNPAFGVYNLLRDLQGAALNLSSTPLAGKQMEVIGNALPAAWGMYRDLRSERRGDSKATNWAALAEEFEMEGGKTGYRDLFRNSSERAEAIEKALGEGSGVVNAASKAAEPVLGWLSDYNEAIENGVRLSAYKKAKDMGLSNAEAASIAKNLTVNFNRRGAKTAQIGALYAFFNASVQGSARLVETLRGPAGKKIITGGLLLGAMQAVALAAADLDDEPDWLKDKNLIIPLGDGKYFAFPMPLGFHAIPALSRRSIEFLMSGGEKPAEQVVGMMGMFADAFNPIGSAGLSAQTLSPTVADPAIALGENRDFAGREIYTEDYNSLDPTAGYERNRRGASVVGDAIARAIDYATGGDGYTRGALSPTADAVDFLIGQATGGVGREILKVTATTEALITGEDLPNYKIPIVGRMIGDANEEAAVSRRFYEGIKEMNQYKRALDKMEDQGKDVTPYLADNPEAEFAYDAQSYESDISELRKLKRQLEDEDAPRDEIDAVTEEMQMLMNEFNQIVADYKK